MFNTSNFKYGYIVVRTCTAGNDVWLNLHDVAKCINGSMRVLIRQVPTTSTFRWKASKSGHSQSWISLDWLLNESAFRKPGGIRFVRWLREISAAVEPPHALALNRRPDADKMSEGDVLPYEQIDLWGGELVASVRQALRARGLVLYPVHEGLRVSVADCPRLDKEGV